MYQDKVKSYYDYTLNFYKVFWHGETRALHYGVWDNTTKNLSEALLNTNKYLADFAKIRSGEHVLDAGCGVGGSAFWLAKNIGANVTGITVSERQLAKAKELAARYGLESKVSFSLQDYTKTNFPDGSFDVVWSIESVCHALDKNDYLHEAYRQLKPGGRVAIADGFLNRTPESAEERRWYEHFLRGLALDNLAPQEVFTELLTNVGFRNISNTDITKMILPSAKRMARICRLGLPLARFTSLLGITSKLIVHNNQAGIDQLYLVEQGIVSYRMYIAEKP